mmetsp:Transcript_2479/g.5678  ORF Transcript_2479/g.5678 Transcript_2479/m.5678 type:complete len:236 (-) Transcript_2479:812-1519(-)
MNTGIMMNHEELQHYPRLPNEHSCCHGHERFVRHSSILALTICLLSFTSTCNSFTIIGENCYSRLTTRTHTSLLFSSKENKNEDKKRDHKKWEWDGVVIEGSHDDEFETNDPEDAFMPSISFLSLANSVASPALEAATFQESSPSIADDDVKFDLMKNSGKIHQKFMREESGDFDFEVSEDELLEMGGDPSFLLSDDLGNESDDRDVEGRIESESDADLFEWDGTVDEDAHLDLD